MIYQPRDSRGLLPPYMPLTVAFDVDDVLAMLLKEWIRRYNLKYTDTVDLKDLTDWDVSKFVKPECGMAVYDLLTPDMYSDVEPYPEALEVVQNIRRMGARVIFITSCVDGTETAKFHWLAAWGFFDGALNHDRREDFFPAKDKSMVKCHFLFDDNVKNVENAHGYGVLITRPHNEYKDCHGYRLKSITEIPTFVRMAMKNQWPGLPHPNGYNLE